MTDRQILSLTGADRVTFLQGLVTSDVTVPAGRLVYTALLSPQGKYLADFFVEVRAEALLIDVAAVLAPALAQRLAMYRLRADVAIDPLPLQLSRGIGDPPPGALPDPRHPALGWRLISDRDLNEMVDWDALRVTHVIPETGIELTPDTYILEAGFEQLAGVDFRKGCYVGQEVTARMKHKTELRKGLVQVEIEGAAPVGTPILADGREAGTLFTQSGGKALAHLRFDRAGGPMRAGDATVTWTP